MPPELTVGYLKHGTNQILHWFDIMGSPYLG